MKNKLSSTTVVAAVLIVIVVVAAIGFLTLGGKDKASKDGPNEADLQDLDRATNDPADSEGGGVEGLPGGGEGVEGQPGNTEGQPADDA